MRVWSLKSCVSKYRTLHYPTYRIVKIKIAVLV